MNLDEFTPDNNGAGQLNQGQIIGGFFLKTNEQFAKAVKKRVCELNDPAACMEIRIALQLLWCLLYHISLFADRL